MPSATSFTPQSQETLLDDGAIDKLRNLKNANTTGQSALDKHLQNVLKYTSQVASEINDKAYVERNRLLKRKNRLAAQGQDVPQEDIDSNDELQERVQATTKKLDLATRQAVDDLVWVQDLPEAIEHVIRKANAALHKPTQQTQLDDEHEDDLDTVDGTHRTNARNSDDSLTQPDPSENPTALLHAAISTTQTKWKSKSLTARYSENNDYIDFYRSVYHANHQGENAPPMPHASTWFAAEEGRSKPGAKSTHSSTSRSKTQHRVLSDDQQDEDDEDEDEDEVDNNAGPRRSQTHPNASNPDQNSDPDTSMTIDADDNIYANATTNANANIDPDSDPEIEALAERIRITCPLTLQPYTHPYRSTKCPHAFEKQAIFDILSRSTDQSPLTEDMTRELSQISSTQARAQRERQLRVQTVKCPECGVPLSEKDLRPDPVLKGIVKREMDRRRRVRELEERGGRGRGMVGNEEGDSSIMLAGRSAEVEVDVDGDDEDEDDDDDLPRGTQRRKFVHIGSSPAPVRSGGSRASGRIVKNERLSSSVVPQTQLSQSHERGR